MSGSSPSGMRARVRDGLTGLAGTFRLAKEMERRWLSLPLTGLLLLLLGFLVVPSISGVFELRGFGEVGQRTERFYNAFFSDCLFLVICAFLGVRVGFRDYALVGQDSFLARLQFLRKLPIGAGSVVGGRALGMLLALIVGAPSFFLPAFLLSDLGELGISYVWFAGVWVGYGLVASGLYLLFGLTANGRARISISVGCALSLLVLALLEWTLELNLVGTTTELAQDYGPLPAVLSILGGCAAFAILSRAAVHLVRSRDLSGGFS